MPDTLICSTPGNITGELLLEQEEGSLTALRPLESERQNGRSREVTGLSGSSNTKAFRSTDNEMLARACRQLREYFSGWRQEFSLPLAPGGSEFQRRVWQELQKIPPGETRTYGQIADKLGRPGAARAVGNTCGANPIMIIIPCHRVIRADGSPGGYGGGKKLKKKLLRMEARNFSS